MTLRVGTLLYGYCGSYFGRDSYRDKRIEAIGADWVVARDDLGNVEFFTGTLEVLEQYTTPAEDDF